MPCPSRLWAVSSAWNTFPSDIHKDHSSTLFKSLLKYYFLSDPILLGHRTALLIPCTLFYLFSPQHLPSSSHTFSKIHLIHHVSGLPPTTGLQASVFFLFFCFTVVSLATRIVPSVVCISSSSSGGSTMKYYQQ